MEVEDTTYYNANLLLKNHIKPRFEKLKLQNLNAERCQEFVSNMSKKDLPTVLHANSKILHLRLFPHLGQLRFDHIGKVATGTLITLGQSSSIDEAEAKAKNIRNIISIKPDQIFF